MKIIYSAHAKKRMKERGIEDKGSHCNIKMKIDYDNDVDAAYIYLEYPLKDASVKKTIELNENIILDFSGSGKLVGVEILDASKTLNKQILLEAAKN